MCLIQLHHHLIAALLDVSRKRERKSEGSEPEPCIKQICLNPPSSMSLRNFPISSHCPPLAGGVSVATPQALPATTSTGTVSEASPQSLPMQTPIFIIYTGAQPVQQQQQQQQQLLPQPPKNSTAQQLNGKTILHKPNGQILTEAVQRVGGGHILTEAGPAMVLQAPAGSSAGQAFPIVNGNGLTTQQAQIVLSPPPPQANGITTHHHHHHQQQQKCEISNRHFPGIVNGQTVVQDSAHNMLVNINGTTALLQPSNGCRAATILPPPHLVSSRPPVVMPATSLHQQVPTKRHSLHKQNMPTCIPHTMISEGKKTPPPLVQVKEEDPKDDPMISGGVSHASYMTPVVTSTTSSAEASPKMIFPLKVQHSQSPSPKATPPSSSNQASLSRIFLQGDVPLIQPPPSLAGIPCSSNMAATQGMPVFRFNTLQPLQIISALPPHNSCEAR